MNYVTIVVSVQVTYNENVKSIRFDIFRREPCRRHRSHHFYFHEKKAKKKKKLTDCLSPDAVESALDDTSWQIT